MSTFAQHQDSTESVALFVSHGPLEAYELMRAIGKILEEKLDSLFTSECFEERNLLLTFMLCSG